MGSNEKHSAILVDLTRIATPGQECVCLRIDDDNLPALMELQAAKYEFAPVIDGERVLGFVSTEYAQRLCDTGQHLSVECIASGNLPPSTTIHELCDELIMNRATLVGNCETWRVTRATDDWGFLTISDLNRHYLRSIVYSLVAEVETGLAKIIEACRLEVRNWLQALSDDAKARVLGYWELAKLQNVDTGALSACTLTDLFKIAGFDPLVLNALRFPSKTQFNDSIGSLHELRNQVMHPVRPMILGSEDVIKLKNRLVKLEVIAERIDEALSNIRATAANA